MTSGDPDDRALSDEVLMLAARAQARAAGAPREDDIRNLAAEAMARGKGDVGTGEVRRIMDQAIGQTHELSRLLRRLAVLTAGGERR